MTIDAGNDPLGEIIRAAANLFPEFAFLGPSGVLDVVGPFEAVDRIRFELSNGEYLHLQGVGVQVVGQEGDDGAFVHSVASVTASDWYNKYATSHDSRAFFDVDHPRGTQVHTSTENEVAWVEISFARPLDVASLRLRNVAQATTSNRARDLRVLTSSGGDWRLRFDGTARGRDLEDLVKSAAEHTPAAAGLGPLLQVAALTIRGDYPRARLAFDAIEITPEVKGHFYAVMNREVLAERSLEWTAHGPRRSFRFWTEAEKFRYTDMTAQVAAQLKELTPNVCLGFGAALCVVRDGDLIPHDDDLDIIIAFEPDEAATLPQALRPHRGVPAPSWLRRPGQLHRPPPRPEARQQARRRLRRDFRGRHDLVVSGHPRKPRPQHDVPDVVRGPAGGVGAVAAQPVDLPRDGLRVWLAPPGSAVHAHLEQGRLRRPDQAVGGPATLRG